MRILSIFRRELRLSDNPLLADADTAEIVPLFILDDFNLKEFGANPTAFFFSALRRFRCDLERVGGRLYVIRPDEFAAFVDAARPDLARFCHDVEPYSRARDDRLTAILDRAGVRLEVLRDCLLTPMPERVYPSFAMFWTRHVLPNLGDWRPSPAPVRLNVPELDFPQTPLPRVDTRPASLWLADESEVLRRWEDFRSRVLPGYAETRDRPDQPGVSRMSPYLRTGMISLARLFAQSLPVCPAYARELAWGDFFAHILHNRPETPDQELRPNWRGFPWKREAALLAAWKEGRTGVAIVDAGMRQLNQEGWMHNRVRMIVASYLTKHLGLDWRLGERHFYRTLVDAELARNVGNWQWAAGCGADAMPYFRIFNPLLQAARFDPDGHYVRRYVPELARVRTRDLHKTPDLSGLAPVYPPPLVNLGLARTEFLRQAKAFLNG